ncbi:putative ATP-dependent RNA helicase DBP4 [Rosellinia necatrix]|uniref:ATP-dependent RNA helicase n=1 Tax=Rosellinia necatrix TaxID=77044 RepID=A0A1W2TAX1_ROSNE|nr:putative ATP-dependent RNA helicase DBP4 [Rosellinia necatrix]
MPSSTEKRRPPHQQAQRQRKQEPRQDAKTLKRKREQVSLEQLQDAVDNFDPKTADTTKFSNLPLSSPTASGIEASHFQSPTDIQAQAIPAALKGRDILGAAKTGSGKTVAFLVPVLEKLYRARWTEYDGLGALIISPTRELAVQTFQVLTKIGRFHSFSAGLVIGGKNLKEEAERLGRMSILVCTPGRMLQHLDSTSGLQVDNLQILVLDEADRIMDMGFKSAVDALVEHLPKERQTLLFSATQSRKVSDLSRLSLKDPEYIAVHESAAESTPDSLQQHYLVTPLASKLNTLYGFIKSNLRSKIIVFFSSGKQVRFAFETMRHLRPGVPLYHLLGAQKQAQRMQITSSYAASKHACLFATDVVARGVDFPSVDWVVQVDAPEDVDTYIHRVGRTARFNKDGKAVLFLDPSEEEGMLKRLELKKIPIKRVNVRENKKQSIDESIQSMIFKDPALKYLASKAFISYVRSIHLQRDKEIFKLKNLDLEAYAASLGLPGAPIIHFAKGEDVKKLKNMPRAALSDSDSEFDEQKKRKVRTKTDKMFERTNQDVLTDHYTKLIGKNTDKEGDEDSEDDFLAVKRVIEGDDLDTAADDNATLPPGTKVIHGLGGEEPFIVDSNRREKMLKSKKKMLKFKGKGDRIVFDDEGIAHHPYRIQGEEDFKRDGSAEAQRQKFVEGETARVQEADADDKALAKEKRREKKERRKAREAAEDGAAAIPRLKAPDDDNDGDDGKEDALAFLASLPVAGGIHEDGGDSGEEGRRERPRKRAKKWFEDDDSADDEKRNNKKGKKGRGKVIEITEEPDTLEDYETLAAGLLDD